jgi:CubicO group peptidase (beta-lactamase class C family)
MRRQTWIWVLVCSSAPLQGGDAPKESAGLRERIDGLLAKQFPADEPGAAVLVVHNGHILLEKGYGLANLDRKTPITPATNFDLASVSKQFTAFAVMLLADRGKLAFDDDFRKYVPELPAPSGPRPIRIRDLLNHTSGIPSYTGFWQTMFMDFTKLTNERIIEMLKNRKPGSPPGTEFDYSNTNYVLLAEIVHRVSHQRFGEFMRDEAFRPLGMERTVVMDDLAVTIPERATGYQQSGKRWEKSIKDGPACGDGNVFSNLRDLARWDAAISGEKLAKPETWRLALTSGKLDNGDETDYGFGWMVESRLGRRFIWHNGAWAGTRTMIGRCPDDRLTIVVLSNNERTDPEKVVNQIANLVLGK